MSVSVISTPQGHVVAERPTLRIFVSSPQDVKAERAVIAREAAAINTRFSGRITVELVLWEERSYDARRDFQSQIDDPAKCDALIAILWSRYGSPLQGDRVEPGARPRYQSGTAFEIDAALATNRVDVLVYRKTQAVFATLNNAAALDDAREQYDDLNAYLDAFSRTEKGANKRAVNEFSSVEDFRTAIRRQLETLVRRRLARHRRVVWDPASDTSPFPGLNSYGVGDGDLFFGRARKAELALEALLKAHARRRGFLLVAGPSGSGKSSLMKAGVVPRLLADSVSSGCDDWRVAAMRPSDRKSPFLALAIALLGGAQASAEAPDGRLRTGPAPLRALPELAGLGFGDAEVIAANWAALGAQLAAEARAESAKGRSIFNHLDDRPKVAAALSALVESALDRAGRDLGDDRGYQAPARVGLLILLDQMEELLPADDSGSAANHPQGDVLESFSALLAAFIATGRIAVVATFRADLYGRLMASRPLMSLTDAGATYLLAPPGGNEIQEIVVASAEAFGLSYERDPVSGATLDERLLADGQGQHALPLLQYTLHELYKARSVTPEGALLTFSAYQALGGVEGAIEATAEKAMEQARRAIGARADAALVLLIRSLVGWVQTAADSAGTVVARPRRLDWRSGHPDLLTVADALIAARVLVAERDETEPAVATIRIAHERVLDAWSAAADVKRNSRDAIRSRDRLMAQFAEWTQHGRNDDRLIQPGAKLREALDYCASYGEEVAPEIAAYVASSHAADERDRARRRRIRIALPVAAAVALLAGLGMVVAGVIAIRNSELAQANYRQARDMVASLIREFSAGLADIQGLPVRTVDRVFASVGPLVENLASRGGDDAELARINGSLHYHFANLYRDIDIGKAKLESDRSFALRERQFALDGGRRREIAEEMADSLELRGDIDRKLPAIGDVSEIAARRRRAYAASLAIRQKIFDDSRGDPRSRFGLSATLIRLGDLESGQAAMERYRAALDLLGPALAASPEDRAILREVSWAANKIGDIALSRAPSDGAASAEDPDLLEASRHYTRSLCSRSALVEADPTGVLARRDLAYALRRLGNLEEKRRHEAGALAVRFEELRERRKLAEDNKGNAQLSRELALNLSELVGTLRRFKPAASGLQWRYLQEAAAAFDRPVSAEAPMNGEMRSFRAALDRDLAALAAAGADRVNVDGEVALLERQYAVIRPTQRLCVAR